MRQSSRTLKAIPQTTLRRLRNTPSYFFLLWRWVSWLYAFITLVADNGRPNPSLATFLLVITFLQTLTVTLYAPIFNIFLPTLPGMRIFRRSQSGNSALRPFWQLRSRPPLAADEEGDILTPIARTRNPRWDFVIFGLDVVICGMVTYLGGYFGIPHFGSSSPFYRYGISTALAAAFSYRYRGGLAAALGYDLFILVGAFFPPPGTLYYPLLVRDLAGSLLDAPVIAILAAYLATLLESYTRSRRREQDNVRLQKALRNVSETLLAGASDRQSLLQYSAEQMRKGGHFERLLIALVVHDTDAETGDASDPQVDVCVESGFMGSNWADRSRYLLEQVIQTGKTYSSFEPPPQDADAESYGMAHLYLPIFLDGRLYLIVGAESTRRSAFELKQEEFLSTTGPQLVVAIENMRLTEQSAALAAEAERGRIARDIHDGVAQLVYMLSLNSETCAALAHRIAEASQDEEDQEVLNPLTQRLDTLVKISKQALWETRHYMFTLKPLISGNSTLTEMLTNQVREFETISDLPVQFEVTGRAAEDAEQGTLNNGTAHRRALVGTAIFRITQEALTNAYKHANATRLVVKLHYSPTAVEIEICDNGKGFMGEQQRIYSGHGLSGMRTRAEELGGTFAITSLPEGGVSVQARLPQ